MELSWNDPNVLGSTKRWTKNKEPAMTTGAEAGSAA